MSEKIDTPEILAEDLHKWITEIMKFKGYGSAKKCPTQEDLKRICNGQYKDVWRYITSHIRLARDVRQIRGNLLLLSNQVRPKSSTSEVADEPSNNLRILVQSREELLKLLTSEEETLGYLESDLARLKSDLQTHEMELKRDKAAVVSRSHAKRLVEKFSNEIKKNERRVDELVSMVVQKANAFDQITKRNSAKSSLLMTSYDSQPSESEVMESKCFIESRKCCMSLEKFIQEKILKDQYSKGYVFRSTISEDIISSIREIISNHTADEVISSLTKMLDQSIHQLKIATMGLSTKIQKTISSSETFDLLLQTCKIKMLELNIEADKFLNGSQSLEKQNIRIEHSVLGFLKQKFSGQNFLLARSIYELTKGVNLAKIILNTLKKQSEELEKRVDALKRENDELERGYSDMANFEEVMEENQKVIHCLIKEIATFHSVIKEQQKEVTRYVLKNLIGQKEKCRAMVHGSSQLNSREIDIFYDIGLQNTKFLSNKAEVSIHWLFGNESWPYCKLLMEILDTLKFPIYLSLDELLPHASLLVSNISASEYSKKESRNSRDFKVSKIIANELKELSREIKEKERLHVEEHSSALHKRLTTVNQVIESSSRMKLVFSDWWTQPGQMVVPWVRVDDLCLHEWLGEWKVAVSRLRRHVLT